MYILELVVKLFKKKKVEKQLEFDPLASDNIEISEECEHIFMPVDSTGEILACSKCGLVVNRKDLKDKNIFKT
ncbi:MAG: hypothetical protein BHW55_10500 [Candidatus Melainabacteria bacterium 35_41]|nr:MAG: hypothetical protein BHW55_10500 [Candidatus Melainabacteria bacterium 35_41]